MDTTRLDEDFFVIDMDRLIEKWTTFSRDYLRKALALADARADWERAKRQRDVVEAELDKDIRINPGDYEVPTPVRETAISKAILLNKRYRTADEEVIKAKHTMDIHQSFVDAMDVMKKGLESTAYLQQSAYHSEPKARGEARTSIDDMRINKAFGVGKPREN